MSVRRAHSRGFSFSEISAVLAIVGLMSAMSLPALSRFANNASFRGACNEVAHLLVMARDRAILKGQETALRWVASGGDLVFTMYEDGNKNGVLADDIRRGVDKPVYGPFSLRGKYPGIAFAFVAGFAAPDPSGNPIGNLGDPVRLGNSNMCSFSPFGKASPGTIYVSNGATRQAAVRITPASGRIQVLEWTGPTTKWVRRYW